MILSLLWATPRTTNDDPIVRYHAGKFQDAMHDMAGGDLIWAFGLEDSIGMSLKVNVVNAGSGVERTANIHESPMNLVRQQISTAPDSLPGSALQPQLPLEAVLQHNNPMRHPNQCMVHQPPPGCPSALVACWRRGDVSLVPIQHSNRPIRAVL